MRRMIKVLAVATLVAVILVASISPALALRRAGGVLLEQTAKPCDAPANPQGVQIKLNPPERELLGCWVLLPPSAP